MASNLSTYATTTRRKLKEGRKKNPKDIKTVSIKELPSKPNIIMGRPSKYNESIPQQMIEFFSVPPYREIETVVTNTKTGESWTKYEERANDLPLFESFALYLGVNSATLWEWANDRNEDGTVKKPIFSEAYKMCKDLQKAFLLQNGLKGLFQTAAFIFTAKNLTDMRDRQEIDHTTDGEKIKSINYLQPDGDSHQLGGNKPQLKNGINNITPDTKATS